MKNKLIYIAMVLLFGLLSVNMAQAATKYINGMNVERIFVGDGKITLVITGNVNNVCYFSYYNNSLFVKYFGETDSNAILSTLLSAKAMGKKIKLAYNDNGNQGGSIFDVNNVGQTMCSIRWVMMDK